MKEGRNNTILLTVIGIATLLVAVAGATFAYFSAQSKYQDANSTLTITAGSGGSMKFESGLIDLKNIYPREAAWVTKGFSITNTSVNTTAADIKYKLSLVSTTDFSSDALTYEFAEAGTSGVCINPKIVNNEITGCNDAELAKSTTQTGDTIASAKSGNITTGTIELGKGAFKAGTKNQMHVYKLTIFFKNKTGVNQNADQDKSYNGYITAAEDR
jgi:hypothetical protein